MVMAVLMRSTCLIFQKVFSLLQSHAVCNNSHDMACNGAAALLAACKILRQQENGV